MDWENIVTPINVDKYEQCLRQSGFDVQKLEVLLSGFHHRFDISYRGPIIRQDQSNNLPITVGSEQEIWDKLMKKVSLGRHAGPFHSIPFKNYVQSPIGLVPKAGNKTRLIFHLSYDFGSLEQQKGINFHTPEDFCSVKYRDLDYAVHSILNLICDGKVHFPDETDRQNVDCSALQRSDRDVAQEEQDAPHAWIQRQCTNKTIFMGKSNLQSAFRILPIKPQQRRWLVMKAKNPMSGKFMFFVDKNLPFGASSSCSRFQLFSDSVKHIIEHQLNMPFTVTNYLDDYLFIVDDQDTCNAMVSRFLLLCKNIGCPVSIEKTEWASSQMIFLGILIDGEKQFLCIPEDKKIKAMDLLNWAITHKKVTIKFIQRLTGVLNFLSKAIIPGRAYIREMYKNSVPQPQRDNL